MDYRTTLGSQFPATSDTDTPARRLRRGLWLSVAVLAGVPGGVTAQAVLPQGGTVVQGDVSIGAPGPQSLTITQGSNSAVVNWNSFSIGSGARVDIHQPPDLE